MKRVWNTYLLACVAAAASLVLARPAVAAPIISIDPSAVTVAVGEEVSLAVKLTGAEAIQAYQVSVAFNSGILNATLVEDGTFFDTSAEPDAFTFYFNDIDNAAGILNFAGFFFNSLAGMSGDGLLATLHFTALKPGTTAITPQFSLTDEAGNVIDGLFDINFLPIEVTLVPGCVAVASPCAVPVPEPSIALLVATGLGAAARWRRRRQA
jgi:hypothetical protein